VLKVQELTDITLTFTVEHTHYAGTSITVEFPNSISLPTTGSSIAIETDSATGEYWK
jgi:hypothetical protein